MTKQHRATPEQWGFIELYADSIDPAACILELRARIEALEAAQQPPLFTAEEVATDAELCKVYNDAPEHGFGPALRAMYDLGRQHGVAPIRSGPESPLLDRVADAIGAADDEGLTNMTWSNHSRAAILEVAAWLRAESEGHLGSGLHWAKEFEREASR